MQEPTKFCTYCGMQNNLSAQFCQKCGAQYIGPPPPVLPARPKETHGLPFYIACGLGLIIVVSLISWILAPPPRAHLSTATLTPSTTPSFPGNETRSQTMSNKEMPEYAQVSNVASQLGFQLGAFKNNGSSIFMVEATQFIGSREFRFVVMGPASDRVDTVRIQAWGIQTKQARQQLERWATRVLASLNRGQLPRDFIRQLYAGDNVGDDGVSNGFCNVQVLQRPSNPGVPSASDRITIDLIFDKTD
jgi:zinc ribbon protein